MKKIYIIFFCIIFSFIFINNSVAQYRDAEIPRESVTSDKTNNGYYNFKSKNNYLKSKTAPTEPVAKKTTETEDKLKDAQSLLKKAPTTTLKQKNKPIRWEETIEAPSRKEYKKIRVDETKLPKEDVAMPKMARETYDEEEYIFLYMKDFTVSKTVSGRTKCDVTFYVDNQTNEMLSRLSYRLKWNKMETTLSFNNIIPRMNYQYKYSLFGEGCYSMDVIPTIIVNKCRIKGKSQDACANMIIWQK